MLSEVALGASGVGEGIPDPLSCSAIEAAFNDELGRRFRTRLSGGHAEPLYLPPAGTCWGALHYRRDHSASALHEVAHWCVAGAGRRRLVDFGYEYVPAPRTLSQQVEFLRGEEQVQALECWFAEAAGVDFCCSFDDVEDHFVALRSSFQAAVYRALQQLRANGAPPRAEQFRRSLTSLRQR